MKNLITNLLYFGSFLCFLQNKCQALRNSTEDLSKLKKSVIEDSDITASCKHQLVDYLNGLESKSKWALNMLYSGAAPVRSSNSLGSFDECIDVKSSGAEKSYITGQYCVAFAGSSKSSDETTISKRPILKPGSEIGTCVPNGCRANDTKAFYFLLGLDLTIDESLCQTKEPDVKLTPTLITATTIFSAIFLSILLCTIYDFIVGAKGVLIKNLSLRTNFHKMISEGKANQLLCLHGVRALCTLGVTCAHVQHNQTYLPIINSWYLSEWNSTVVGAVVLIMGNIAVNTFFLLSGFLIGYTFMKLLERNGQLNVAKHYLNRYLRLTPAIAAVLLFYVSYFQYLGSGPFWPHLVTQKQVVTCDRQWWMALLYIQNFAPSNNYCISQSWYLTVDMQLYIFSPLLLYVIQKRPQCFLTFCKGLLLSSFLYTLFVVLYFKPSLSQTNPNAERMAITYSWYNDSVIINATPWFTGIALSYLVTINQGKNVVISKVWLTVLWAFSVGVIIMGTLANSIVVSNQSNHPILEAFCLIVFKISWAISIAWVIFACIFNYAGWLNSFLSWPIFQFVSKLSFSMYLVHNAVNFTILGQYRYPVVFGNFETMSLFCITTVLTMFFAILLMLFVELPGMAISDYFLKRKAPKRDTLLVSQSDTENNC